MNITLRDSERLQQKLLSDSKRNALPRAQMHPELLEPHLDAESGGFILRTENPIDIKLMGYFFGELAEDKCTAAWRMLGKPREELPSELIFTFDGGGKIVCRTQANGDVTRLTSVIPSDRSMKYDVTVHEGQIIFLKQATQADVPSSSKTVPQLQLEAAKLGVKWLKTASTASMIEKIEEAKAAKSKLVTV